MAAVSSHWEQERCPLSHWETRRFPPCLHNSLLFPSPAHYISAKNSSKYLQLHHRQWRFPVHLRRTEVSASKIFFPDSVTVKVWLFWWGLGFLGPHCATEMLQRLQMSHVMPLCFCLLISWLLHGVNTCPLSALWEIGTAFSTVMVWMHLKMPGSTDMSLIFLKTGQHAPH